MNALTRMMTGARAERPAPAGGTTLQERGARIGGVLGGFLRRTSRTGFVLYALALGAVLGLASADFATRGGYPFGGTTIGAWTAWPKTGSTDADPYSRAVNARRGEIPLAIGEGLLLTAATDNDGRTLDAGCTYAIGGVVPPARAWTLTIAGRGAADPAATPLREGFTSTEILRGDDDRFVITIGRDVQSGNWLPMPRPKGPVRLALRLYDTPVAASVGSLDRNTLPAITRLGCSR
ncbi:membrane protein [Methylobacterium haplocladii]|uniref:Membrane protein n=2 Tax=Methylobacterium haplocladii TaxID=1176176 RepID=A0A512IJY1_9HYPH|nr:DUF1214 domain-containing protein [Methylobacterium haplocladii]GEO98016.1 membrane protein [Methylobacterium haplocladii]GJD86067.1 hypothetical protein HPGCJGGD_3964 [Methylobacterium haplocladii]GLS57917.1 membrane protein [Methylobacterium haplocladii]